jgi:enoyl-CoA hydratase/carnithine racemase
MASVIVGVTGTVARVTLSNPRKLNAMSRAMWRELRAAFESIALDPALRCIVVAGEASGDVAGGGNHFSAGGDISEYAAFRFNEASLREFHESDVWGALQAMIDCTVPIIASIEGNCMGAGLEIASCCDIRLAADDARFGAPIARLGFPMAPREAALVVGAVGELTAREMLLAASVPDASQMQQRGFLSSVCAASSLAAAVQEYVDRVCQLAPQAAAMNKRSFRAMAQSIRAQAATELIANAYQYADSFEHREGVGAFMQKRPPQF